MQDRISTYKYLWIFIVVIVVILVVGSIYRIVSEVNKSTFKNNSFALLIVSSDSKYIYVDKERKSALFLALGDIDRFVKGKNNLEVTFSLGIPVNAILYTDTPPRNIKDFTSSESEFKLLIGGTKNFKNLNKFDIFKIIGSLKAANKDNIKEKRVDIFNESVLKSLEGDFIDSVIRNSNLTVQINNGTTINGLGNLLALILTRQGYNVIAVRTAKPELSSFVSYEGESSRTTDALISLTGFDYRIEKTSQASDITVYLGEDVDAMLSP